MVVRDAKHPYICRKSDLMSNTFRKMIEAKAGKIISFKSDESHATLCPDMGGRIFAELSGLSVHRIDLDCVLDPTAPFNNFGGCNFWPAPEGGKFGFNYVGDEWYVQPSINQQPFETLQVDDEHAIIQKNVRLTNKSKVTVDAIMRREFTITQKLPSALDGCELESHLSYQTLDSFKVQNDVTIDQAMIAVWTLEQFDTSDNTVAFCVVEDSPNAINFDFYPEHPGERISYFTNGFTYKTDGQSRGQIGIKKSANASCIGFYDLSRKLICIREITNEPNGLYFNIADNDQPDGPYSAADNYSMFNSDSDMSAFELETVGSADVKDGRLIGSTLTSATYFAIFKQSDDLKSFIDHVLGKRR